ncbi:hypothetical protein DPMN_033889 [Dreissena polymorpha]|uniref:Uncharacterized protein n=1 Tax=Dreissena polymorpha TaxID=45954 RepID=A0A9D4M5Q1_DREPO|nr:hypothetical protein DPMN_033889 [Dreissena polymorpha]
MLPPTTSSPVEGEKDRRQQPFYQKQESAWIHDLHTFTRVTIHKVPVPRDFFGYVWDNRMSTNHRFSVVERSKHSRESPNTKPPTHGKENISVAANLFLHLFNTQNRRLKSVWGVKCQQKHDKVITYLALVSGQGLREEKIEETVSRDRNAIQKGTLEVRLTKSKGMFFPE